MAGLRQYARANYGVALTDAEARAYRAAFFRAYPALRAWHTRVEAALAVRVRADPDGVADVRTLGGRRRALAVAKRRADRAAYPNLTEHLNTPVQGTGADGLKAAIALLWERRAECPGAVPVLFCHDEIVTEVATDHVDTAAAWLARCMTDGMAPLVAPVPVAVSVGATWAG